MAPWKVTITSIGWPRALLEGNATDAKIETYIRETLERYPHCRNIMIFHESIRESPYRNAPELFGMRGFHVYEISGTSAEMQRWVSRLYRNYGIEGKTEMLSKDPLRLDHVRNPDFDDGTEGWTIRAAETGSWESCRCGHT